MWLPSRDIQHFRLSSRSIASGSHPNLLPQFFWRSRFSLDFEMGFVRPTQAHSPVDWRSLYFSVKHEMQLPQGSPRLRNRKRIWQIINWNISLFDLYSPVVQLQGFPISWDNLSMSSRQEISLQTPTQGRIITTELRSGNCDYLQVGSREIFIRSLPDPLGNQYIRAIGVSTVIFNSQMFISALRLLTKDCNNTGYASHSLGYVDTSTETFLWIPPNEHFIGVELVTRQNGISAIRTISSSDSGVSSSEWLGDVEGRESNFAFGTICVQRELAVFNLVVSFDAFKMISVAIVDGFDAPRESKSPKNFTRKQLIQLPLWTPSYPKPKPIIQVPEILEYQTYNPILNMDFGGEYGEHLQKLIRIVAHMQDNAAPLVGLMFYFNGKDPAMYGKQGATEVSFIIDGSGGERIVEVLYERATTSLGIWSLSASNSVFQTFGLQCSYTNGQPIQSTYGQNRAYNDPLNDKLCYSVGSYVMAETGCTASTAASLEGARRIRFSCGSPSRTRRADEVSGLWLDYFDSRPSEIVGQWISDIDCMDIEPNEKITEVSIWLTKDNSSWLFQHLGRVVRIVVRTSHMQSKDVHVSEFLSAGDFTVLRFPGNQFEKLVSFCWIFNAGFDHPRVLSSPVTESERIILWDARSCMRQLRWTVPEKAFWQINSDGRFDQVIAISAYRIRDRGNEYLTGLKFSYQTGYTSTIGCTDGRPCSEAYFEDGERLVILEVLSDYHGTLDIVLHSDRVGPGQARKSQSFAGKPIEIPEYESVRHDRVDFSTHWLRTCIIDKVHSSWDHRGPTSIPYCEMVGLWGFDMSPGKLGLGVILLEKSEDSSG
ncbi:hypothetical protein C8Q69DRAFT_445078 [Paecilomyces variotii]|uniref:DUF7600 domain-containing protein n=1 Tax=Byssochlamys spectabilis TaxID=264951 RepID=A0A443HTI4_BYSSP|nr:hypothetical protein C8Q69DRAFT_445078 [Paecilomyces variotii]RWQ95132.1 hypothetical protein C8Q69DRAFT_445078 [Paecilomyces variotii]